MAFAIPKLEYKNGSTTGTTTSASGTITGVEDTSDIEAGMFIEGTGIPAGALVASVTETEILLASGVLCTASTASVTLTFGHRIAFDYPPKEPRGEQMETKATVSEALSGSRQVAVNYIEGNRDLTFSFLTQTIYNLVNTFLQDHALLGEEFRYYEDKTTTTYADYELDTFKVQPRKIAPKGQDVYVWEVPLKFRRVL
jgi:hypothetical protein